eukprot:CAMPEP_0196580688 /NCGR_PEP_ID=MMETSP1081-20130531/30107_1 /TAXON_ID=36882 /ORGANISM="Pyramimonas amylifera, Strain CCMP720" /LENGTH=370 /DNA_ID=CAMNT_0041900639 /DNA_START=265 /DNA_END=1377 /DNA_ORIENTATION=+
MAPRRSLLAPSWHPKSFGKDTAPKESSEGGDGGSNPEGEDVGNVMSEETEAGAEVEAVVPAVAAVKMPAPFGPGTSNADVLANNCSAIFAAFFVSKPGGFKRPPGVRCNGCHESPLHITFDSAKIMHPGTCLAILTDMETDFSEIKGIENVMLHRFSGVVNRESIGTPNLMYERMKTYKAFVQRAAENKYDKHLILLDTDIVIVGDVFHLFDKVFDYALSARGNDNLPVQGGLQLVHKNSLTKASKWLSLVLEDWEETVSQNKRKEFSFTGDQYAYAKTIGDNKAIVKIANSKKTGILKVDKGEKGQFDILLMPADRYNRTPGGAGSIIKKDKVSVLHYKGGRKEAMYVVYDPLKKGGLKAVYALKGMTR